MTAVGGAGGSDEYTRQLMPSAVLEREPTEAERVKQLEHELEAANQQAARLVQELHDERVERAAADQHVEDVLADMRQASEEHEQRIAGLESELEAARRDVTRFRVERDTSMESAQEWYAECQTLIQQIRELS